MSETRCPLEPWERRFARNWLVGGAVSVVFGSVVSLLTGTLVTPFIGGGLGAMLVGSLIFAAR